MHLMTLMLCFSLSMGLRADPSKLNLPPKAISKSATPPLVVKPTAKKTDQTEANLAKLIDAIQRQYNNTKSATFDFDQSYKHPFLAVTENSHGNVSYQKVHGNMVWNYTQPKEKQKKFYISGNQFTYFSVSDKVAYTHNCYNKDTLSASVTFLLGTGSLKDSFTIKPLIGDMPNTALSWVTLIPKEPNAPVSKILLGVNKDFKVMESVVEDPSGGKNHFKFSNFKTNPKIAASVFVFTPPKGVLVQPMPNVSCPEAKPKAKDNKKAPANLPKTKSNQ